MRRECVGDQPAPSRKYGTVSARIDLDGDGFIGRGLVRRLRTAGAAQRTGAARQDPTGAAAPMTVLFTEPTPSLISRERLEPHATR